MLELRDIRHTYDGEILLDDVSFSVGEDEVLCLLGSSGSGKSTILRIIAGFEQPLSGDVLYNGKSILNEPVYKRNFGMVFQDYALFPHMSVYENIAFGLRMKRAGTGELDRMVRAALKQVGMEQFGDRKVTELSGGEQQRVALARSLVVRPSLLMLDEPLGALDYALRQALIGELKEILGKNGIPSIYVTHDQNEAMSLADRIAILHGGKILQTGSPEDLYSHPVNEWCARFLGFNNIVPGIAADSGGILIRNFGQTVPLPAGIGAGSPNSAPRVLLKTGEILTGDAEPGALVLEAHPVSNTYRGDYYDIILEIDPDVRLTLQNRSKAPLDETVRLSYRPEGIILY